MTSPYAAARRRLQQFDARWRDLPLRTRLTGAAALAATVTIVAVVAVAYVAVRHELRGQIDSQLRHQAREVQVYPQVSPLSGGVHYEVNTGVGDVGGLYQVVSADGLAVPGGDALPVSAGDMHVAGSGGTVVRDIHFDGRHMRLLTSRLPGVDGYAIEIAVPLTDVDQQLHALAFAFIVLALVGLGLTVLASWGVVRRMMRPVQSLTETAEQISETRDLTLRISSFGNDELGRLAASFNTMLDALERSLAAQRQLIMDASHELRTPLASLRTNVEVLGDIDRLAPDQRKAILAGIVSQLEELTGLVADVVELARGEAPASMHDDIAFDELVERAVDRARRHWPATRFVCRTTPVQVRGVATRLDRAVANMLDNAGKFSPPGASVEVELESDGRLRVSDEGPGVPEQALPFVFDRFYRADEARAMPGSGLGLAIVKQVVDEHGGTIALSNNVPGGATATMTLPVLDDTERVTLPVEETLFR